MEEEDKRLEDYIRLCDKYLICPNCKIKLKYKDVIDCGEAVSYWECEKCKRIGG